ncbi:cystatin-11-like [Ochotona curzoniae]|uniref:cystatin-11-like n=1 Tax=Ochotona curzoniae TaxID=130825 RepID=UPI001B34ACDA|nr:cystatin-11-like [Ochotona curzoniae]
MARPWQVPQLLLAVLVALLAVTQQSRRKSFVTVYEVSAAEEPVLGCLQFVTNEYNKQSNDTYNFRIIRILRILKQVTDHLEYHMNVEMWRTTCLKLDPKPCDFQEGELYKHIQCFFAVFADPWIEKFKILKQNCSSI